MAGSIKLDYAADAALTQTNLDGISSSSTLVAGWTSGTIDNTSNEYEDYLISATFQAESTGLSAGEIRVYAYAVLDDTPTWPDVFSAGTEGTEGTATIHDSEIRDGAFVLLWSVTTDTGASDKYSMPPTSIAQAFGSVPRMFALFVTQSTGNTLETTGDPNQVYTQPVMSQYT